MTLTEIQQREARTFLPVVNRMPVALVRGEGSRVWDIDGRELVDLTAGWGVTAIGHCHPTLVEAISHQAGQLMQTTNLFYTLPQLDLSDALNASTPPEITRSFYVSSGAEAVEGALKMAHRATERRKFISTGGSFHGRTLGALQVIGQAKHRDAYRDLMPEQVVVPFNDIDAARAAIDTDTAAIIVEPIQGEGGVNVANPGYLPQLKELAHAAGALLILDEIQTGVGRTGRMMALEHDPVVPDILTLGKGLGGGFPIAAFLCTEEVSKTVSPGDHGGTYAGNPLACAAALATLDVIREEKLCERVADVGERLLAHLDGFATEHPSLASNARGRGLLLGMEINDPERAAALPGRCLEAGILMNVTAGNVLRLFPPLNIPEDLLFETVDRILAIVRD